MLQWRADHGFLPIEAPGPYDQAYFDKYVGYAATELGREISKVRVGLVLRHTHERDEVIDIGIGCGDFLKELKRFRTCFGYDVNPASIDWLKAQHMWVDGQLQHGAIALTFWDSLEHIENPWPLVQLAEQWVFVSLPVFTSQEHALRSKHYRPTEHYWYFTHDGLVRMMRENGFGLVEKSRVETDLGREDVYTYAFRRLG